MIGKRLIDCQMMQSAIGDLLCPEKGCQSPVTVCENLALRKGLVTTIKLVCTREKCPYERCLSNPSSPLATTVNAKSVLAMRMVGMPYYC